MVQNFALGFLLSGDGVEAERQFRRCTGKRVGGWAGRIWAWIAMLCCGYFMMRAMAEMGWLGGVRRCFFEDRRMSIVEWGLYIGGVRSHPSVIIAE